MKVEAFMTRDPETIHPHETLAVAREKMDRGRFRRLPVVDDAGKLVGILAEGDLRAHVGYLDGTRVTAAMVENPVTLTPNDSVERAAEILVERKIGGLPIVDEGDRPVGMLTESDLLRCFLELLRAKG
jgi:acetoin utilization protein AcuB